MMTAESMLSKRPVLRFTVASFFHFFSLSYFRPIFIVFRYISIKLNIMITDEVNAGAYLGGGGIAPCPLLVTCLLVKKKTKLMVPSD